MPSSQRPGPRHATLWPAAVFVTVLTGAVLATEVARETVPVLRDQQQLIVQAQRPSDGDHYLANDMGGHIDHHVLFFGTDPEVLERMRAADVLFLGNSRIMFGLRPEELRPFFAAQGLRYYVMGFGYREGDRFPLAIIRKFDLRPRLVVINADGFFNAGLSEWADVVNRDTPFAARKLQVEAEAAHEVRRVVHHLVPNWLRIFGTPGLGFRRGFIAFRSRADGTWDISPWPEGTHGFTDRPLAGGPLARGEIAAARAFKQELDERGSQLVLTRVPSPEPMPGAGPATFAELLGVPLVTATVPALTTPDDSHLSQGSARDWTRAFLAALAPTLRGLRQDDAARPPDPIERVGR